MTDTNSSAAAPSARLQEAELKADRLYEAYRESLGEIRSLIREIETQRIEAGGEVWPEPAKPPRKRSVLLDLAGFKPVPGTLAALADPYRETESPQESEQGGKVISFRPRQAPSGDLSA